MPKPPRAKPLSITQLKVLRDTFAPGDVRRDPLEKRIERLRAKRDNPSPTALTKKELERQGATFDVVEQRLPHSFITRDFLNCIDLIACSPAQGIVGIQITGGDNGAAREKKIAAEPRALVWMQSGGAIEVWSWALRGAEGAPKTWTLRRTRAYLKDEGIAFFLVPSAAAAGPDDLDDPSEEVLEQQQARDDELRGDLGF